jgi:(p)ppGpp synthase/HD superfamily hydrolase
MVLHRFDCGNLIRAKQKGEQWMEVNWQVDEGEEFEVEIHVKIENRRGMLASIANAIAKINVNIENIEFEERDYTMIGLILVISVPTPSPCCWLAHQLHCRQGLDNNSVKN